MANKKVQVDEVAADCGATSQEALDALRNLGEYVKSPRSTLEPPLVRKLRAALQSTTADAAPPAQLTDLAGASWYERKVVVERRYLYRGADGLYEAVSPRERPDQVIGHRHCTHTSGTIYGTHPALGRPASFPFPVTVVSVTDLGPVTYH